MNGNQVADGSNLTDGLYATVLAYTLSDVLPGKLMFKAGAVRIGAANGKDTATNVFFQPEDTTKVR